MLSGITPACAGKSQRTHTKRSSKRDHPRMCGEKCTGFRLVRAGPGSPPHVRGKADAVYEQHTVSGITPACAGKRQPQSFRRCLRWDHPRMCGEKTVEVAPEVKELGSPPHVRGKAHAMHPISTLPRITPACAGKRQPQSFRRCLRWDHPRMCGEKLRLRRYQREGTGITPACAGKRKLHRHDSGRHRDHPRMCGEKTKKIP